MTIGQLLTQTTNEKTHQSACTKDNTTKNIFTDHMGYFIIPSSTENTQLFILYDYNSNSIHAEPITNCTAPTQDPIQCSTTNLNKSWHLTKIAITQQRVLQLLGQLDEFTRH